VARHHAQTVQTGDEEVEEDIAAQLAVGHDIDARVLLQPQGTVDGTVLDQPVLLRRQLARPHRPARLHQHRWAEQRPHDLGTVDTIDHSAEP